MSLHSLFDQLFFPSDDPEDGMEISYSIASKRPPKQGRVIPITWVTWEGAPIEMRRVSFESIGSFDIALPIVLPEGYRMVNHESWNEAMKLICREEEIQSLNFQQLDEIVCDWKRLEDLTNGSFGDMWIYEERKDYLCWDIAFEDSWADLLEQVMSGIEQLLKDSIPHKEPGTAQSDGIGNRKMAPTLEDAIAKMFPELSLQSIKVISGKVTIAAKKAKEEDDRD